MYPGKRIFFGISKGVRRVLFFLGLLLLFAKPLFLGSLGLFLRAYAWIGHGYSLEWEAMSYREGVFALHGVQVEGPDGFHGAIPKVTAKWAQKSCHFENPIFSLGKEGGMFFSPSWKISMSKGVVLGEGIVSFHVTGSLEKGKVEAELTWEEGSCRFWGEKGDEAWRGSLLASSMDPRWLARWLPYEVGGKYSGEVAWEKARGKSLSVEGHLEGVEMSLGKWLSRGEGTFEGKGSTDWDEFLEEGSFRGSLRQGEVALRQGAFQKIEGDVTYFGPLGGEATLCGMLQGERCSFVAKLLGKERGSVSVRYADAAVEGEWNGEEWAATLCRVERTLLQGIQDGISLWDPSWEGYSFLEGVVSAVLQKEKGHSWTCLDFEGTSLLVRYQDILLGCQSCSLHDDVYSIQGGAFSASVSKGKTVVGSGWCGTGSVQDGLGALDGVVEGISTQLRWEAVSWEGMRGAIAMEGGRVPFALQSKEAGWEIAVEGGHFRGIDFSGRGYFSSEGTFWVEVPTFAGPIESLPFVASFSLPMEGKIASEEEGLWMEGSIDAFTWRVSGRFFDGKLGIDMLEKVQCLWEVSSSSLAIFDLRGSSPWGVEVYCPHLAREGDFDVRISKGIWDIARLCGKTTMGTALLDTEKSFVGRKAPFSGRATFSSSGIDSFSFSAQLSLEDVALACKMPLEIGGLPLEGNIQIDCASTTVEGTTLSLQGEGLSLGGKEVPLLAKVLVQEGVWNIDAMQLGEVEGKGVWNQKERHLSPFSLFSQGHPLCQVEGSRMSWSGGEISCTNLQLEPSQLSWIRMLSFPTPQWQGDVQGDLHIRWGSGIEVTACVTLPLMVQGGIAIENRVPIHLYYDSLQGVVLQGIDCTIFDPYRESSYANVQVETIHFDGEEKRWKFLRAQGCLFPEGGEKLSLPFSLDAPWRGTATLEIPSDMTSVSVEMDECVLPQNRGILRQAHFFLTKNSAHMEGEYLYRGEVLPLSCTLEDFLSPRGKIGLGKELWIDWHTEDTRWQIDAIEGSFSGVDASFHLEGDSLLGSAKIDCATLFPWVPVSLQQVFSELQMGKGYELMGRMRLEKEGFFFEGILGGKQVELFGYEFRTLLSQIHIAPDRTLIDNLKLSDSAGILSIGSIVAQGSGTLPWTLDIPKIQVIDLRPSKLQKVGEGPRDMTPLVVRSCVLQDFHGILDDPSTYHAKGELTFLNSYKRETTLFDIPSHVLSRIIGIDLDLLIPVRGKLTYELRGGVFHLLELFDSYSEQERASFHLVQTEDSPTMDLSGNLNILIRMKHFVLFTFTESFLIAIDGNLSDPSYHLTRNKKLLASLKNRQTGD